MSENNNEIYRVLKTAFELDDKTLVELWAAAGRKISTSEANSYSRSLSSPLYKPLFSGPLKKWLGALCDREEVEPKGFSVVAYTTALCVKFDLQESNNAVENAVNLRTKLRSNK